MRERGNYRGNVREIKRISGNEANIISIFGYWFSIIDWW